MSLPGKRKLQKVLSQALPTDQDIPAKILYEESNEEYLVLRTIEELRNIKNDDRRIKSLQRSIMMLSFALNKMGENAKQDFLRNQIYGAKTTKKLQKNPGSNPTS